MYEAIITPITNIREHPNADRLVLGTASGFQIITSKGTKEGTPGIFFPSDGQLSAEMCSKNNLYRHSYLNEDKSKKGFFEDNRRVRTQKFRGIPSEGFWAPLEILDFTGVNLSKLKVNSTLHELNGVHICNKYYTQATCNKIKGKKKKKLSKWGFKPSSFPDFAENWDVKKLRLMINAIPKGALLSLSEKCHGTSGRTGHLYQLRSLQGLYRAWNRIMSPLGLALENGRWRYVSGSRRVVLNPQHIKTLEFHGKTTFRNEIHKKLKSLTLLKGETIYYEIVGWINHRPVMPSHPIKDKELVNRYGTKMFYTYGCPPGKYKFLVYRITHTTPEGRAFELPLHQVQARCDQLGLKMVPQLVEPFCYDGDKEELLKLCARYAEGHSMLDDGHIREGVVLRVDSPILETHLKFKSWWFCDLEGIAKNNEAYIDLEEVS